MKLLDLSLVTVTVFTLGTTAVFAKAHDQGVADGDIAPGTQTGAKDTIDALEDAGVLDGRGVSAVVKKGQQGEAASGAR